MLKVVEGLEVFVPEGPIISYWMTNIFPYRKLVTGGNVIVLKYNLYANNITMT